MDNTINNLGDEVDEIKNNIDDLNYDIDDLKKQLKRTKKELDTSELYQLVIYSFIGLGTMFFSNVVSWIMIIVK